jgi:hypothetical protein
MQVNEQILLSSANDNKIILHYEGDNIFSIIQEVNGDEQIMTLTREELFDIIKTVFPNFN